MKLKLALAAILALAFSAFFLLGGGKSVPPKIKSADTAEKTEVNRERVQKNKVKDKATGLQSKAGDFEEPERSEEKDGGELGSADKKATTPEGIMAHYKVSKDYWEYVNAMSGLQDLEEEAKAIKNTFMTSLKETEKLSRVRELVIEDGDITQADKLLQEMLQQAAARNILVGKLLLVAYREETLRAEKL